MAKKKVIDSPKEITQKQLTRNFKDIKKQKNTESRFCFLLGAGASKSSGINTGWELAKNWYEELKEDLTKEEFEKWEQSLEGFHEDKLGEFYTQIYGKRFECDPAIGYEEFKRMMETIEPGLGYAVLSQILTREKHNFVITTNFDYLVEDAVRSFTSKKPFSAGHETLAEFVSLNAERPTIIKVHRDLFLKPFNDAAGTQKLKEQWSKALLPIVNNFNLLVIGYGGNDGSLMDYLNAIDPQDRKAIYWCIRKGDTLNDKINSLLTKKDYVVEIDGFDEFMFGLHDVLEYEIFKELDNPDEHHFVKETKERIAGLNAKRSELLERLKDSQEEISEEVKEVFTGAWEYLIEAQQEKNITVKESIYKEGLEKYPNNANLNGNYAVFLENFSKNYDKSEYYYKKALELNPGNDNNIGNYALFIMKIRKNYNQAEKYFKMAIELAPENSNNITNYAALLYSKKDYDKAEEYFKKAVEFNPMHPNSNGNYALFLDNIKKDYNGAEVYYKKSLELDSTSTHKRVNYAHHLIISKQDFKQADVYINKAFELVREDQLEDQLELWFYRYAYYPKFREQSEKELESLLQKGAKSIEWNFTPHIEIAKENGHPNLKKLQEFADRITTIK